jgi:hypothetical protein
MRIWVREFLDAFCALADILRSPIDALGYRPKPIPVPPLTEKE